MEGIIEREMIDAQAVFRKDGDEAYTEGSHESNREAGLYQTVN